MTTLIIIISVVFVMGLLVLYAHYTGERARERALQYWGAHLQGEESFLTTLRRDLMRYNDAGRIAARAARIAETALPALERKAADLNDETIRLYAPVRTAQAELEAAQTHLSEVKASWAQAVETWNVLGYFEALRVAERVVAEARVYVSQAMQAREYAHIRALDARMAVRDAQDAVLYRGYECEGARRCAQNTRELIAKVEAEIAATEAAIARTRGASTLSLAL